MVIGIGMLANAFKNYLNDDNIIIFASGVSNSQEQNIKEYEREFDLLSLYSHSTKKLIYFSTCSIFDKSLEDSKYIKHKIRIETFIKENFKNYLIFRLPNVIGKTNNNNTSFNYFKNKIINQEEIQIQVNAIRYFIDVDDLVNILPIIISSQTNQTINVCFNNKIYIKDLISIFENILKISAKKVFIDKGLNYSVDNLYFMNIVRKNNLKINENYNFNLIKKYL